MKGRKEQIYARRRHLHKQIYLSNLFYEFYIKGAGDACSVVLFYVYDINHQQAHTISFILT